MCHRDIDLSLIYSPSFGTGPAGMIGLAILKTSCVRAIRVGFLTCTAQKTLAIHRRVLRFHPRFHIRQQQQQQLRVPGQRT
jgi:hypothetical protein